MGKLNQIDHVVLALRALNENDRLNLAEALRDSWLVETGIRPKSAKEISAKYGIGLQRLNDLEIVVTRDQGIDFLARLECPATQSYLETKLSPLMYKNILGRKKGEIARLGSEVLFSYGELRYIVGLPPLPIPPPLAELLAETPK